MAQISAAQIRTAIILTAVAVAGSAIILMIPWVPAVAVVFTVVTLLMMLVILVQKPKGGGLSGAFGGAGGGSAQAAFGSKTGDVLTGVTIIMFVFFLASAVKMTWAITENVTLNTGVQPVAAPVDGAAPAPVTDGQATDGDPTLRDAIDEALKPLPQPQTNPQAPAAGVAESTEAVVPTDQDQSADGAQTAPAAPADQQTPAPTPAE